jgi:ribosome-binding factor A
MVDHARARRLGVRIREIVASALKKQVKDPRLGMVTITEVKVTPDLREATVFYTVLGDHAAEAGSSAALRSATGVLRSAVGRETGIRFTPILAFQLDHIPESAKHIEELLEQARRADEDVQRVAAHARPAGDPDPYRHPEDDDDGTEYGT